MLSRLSIEWILAKDDVQLISLLEKEKFWICLSPEGKLLSSEQFAHLMTEQFQKEGARLNFVIGGPEGLPSALKVKASFLLSLSPLTFTHQLTRLILLEQLYRFLEIQKGSAYHK